MENFDGYIGKITISVLRVGLKKDTKMQLIVSRLVVSLSLGTNLSDQAADDIGHVAVAVFRSPNEYKGRAITVVGDALTTQKIQDAYQRGAGKPMPSAANLVARGVLALNKHTRGM